MSLVRTFIALDLEDEHVRANIVNAQKQILSLGVDAKPVEEENLHFTVRFLGEIEGSKVERLVGALSDIKFDPFKVTYKGMGAFPSLSHINVVWIGVDDESSKSIISLWKQTESALSGAGFPPDSRFDPHLTILRIKSGLHRLELTEYIRKSQDTNFGEDLIAKLKIKKSVLTPEGPIYTDLHVVGL
jgi:2'-5' RNA ligase